MIYCDKKYLEMRCAERGYTLEQVKDCIVKEENGMVMVDENHPRYPRRPDQYIGPGTHLKRLLKDWLGIEATASCSCNDRAATMDLWGGDECEKQLEVIVGWLRDEARKRGLPFVDMAGRTMVRLAIRRSRR